MMPKPDYIRALEWMRDNHADFVPESREDSFPAHWLRPRLAHSRLFPLLITFPLARATDAASLLNSGVRLIKRMPLWAVSLHGVVPPPDSASRVLSVRNRLQMLGVNAVANAAKVIQFQPLGDRASMHLPRKAVGARFAGLSVAVLIERWLPEPTRLRLFDSRPKGFRPGETKGAAPMRRAVLKEAFVMGETEALGTGIAAAIFNRAGLRGTLRTHLGTFFPGVMRPDVSASRPLSIVPRGLLAGVR